MHFWIDKRSSQQHGYGGGSRGRIPGGPGGFYSRTFGQRHHHPPPLLRTQSQPPTTTSSTSSQLRSQLQQQNNANNSNPSHHSHTHNHTNSAAAGVGRNASTTTTVPGQIPTSATSIDSSSSRNHSYHHQTPHLNLSMNPMDNLMMMSSGGGLTATAGNHFDIYPHGMRHGGGIMMTSTSSQLPPNHTSSFPGNGGPNEYYMGSTGGDPVIALSAGGGMGSSGLPVTGRRPRSHSHSASGGPPGRRRSSSSAAPSGGMNQRRSSVNRWTYDPYNISHHQQIRHSQHAQMWPDGRQLGFMEHGGSPNGDIDTSPNGISNPGNSTDLSTNPQNHSSNGVVLGGGGVGTGNGGRGSTSTTSTRSLIDPSWRRTKRIGLTLCFLSFILMSTVAAKFVIEGPWLIDKSPRNERTEATIYFFLTEIIFVLFAMALFFAGVTCLRKRTNAYLLRQFNDYIMHSSPQGGGGRLGDYYGNTVNGENGGSAGNNATHQAPHTGGLNSSQNLGNDRPFLGPHFLPSLENHLMNMHISVAESSNFVMTGLSKPPPYHIALYLPVPDEGCENPSVRKEDTAHAQETNHKYKHRLPAHMQNPSNGNSSGRISGDNDDITSNDKTEDDSGPDEGGERDQNQDGEGGPRRKRRRSNDRPETPPPPYGQI